LKEESGFLSMPDTQEYRNSLESQKKLQVQTMEYGPIPLETVADIK
jgi:Cu(I)/Ag(I) efflux system membrane protein CusA/SilA